MDKNNLLKHLATLAITTVLLSSCCSTQEEKALTVADYENAALHLGTNMNNYVYNTVGSKNGLMVT